MKNILIREGTQSKLIREYHYQQAILRHKIFFYF